MDRAKGFNVIFYTDRTDVRGFAPADRALGGSRGSGAADYINHLRSHPERTPAKTGAEPLMFSGYDSGYEARKARCRCPIAKTTDLSPQVRWRSRSSNNSNRSSNRNYNSNRSSSNRSDSRTRCPKSPLRSLQTCRAG